MLQRRERPRIAARPAFSPPPPATPWRIQSRSQRRAGVAGRPLPPGPAEHKRRQCRASLCPAAGKRCSLARRKELQQPAPVLPPRPDSLNVPVRPGHVPTRARAFPARLSARRVAREFREDRSSVPPELNKLADAGRIRLVAGRALRHVLVRPRRQQFYKHPQNPQRQQGQPCRHQEAFFRDQRHLVGCVAQQAL